VVSINELTAALSKEGISGPIDLRADQQAWWMHVQWVMAELGRAGHGSVRCIVRIGKTAKEGIVTVRIHRGTWEESLFSPSCVRELPAIHPGVVEVLGGSRGVYRFVSELDESGVKTSDPAIVRRWAERLLRKTWRAKGARTILEVEGMGTARYGDVARALAELQAVGAKPLEVGLEALHPWDRDLHKLPDPPPRHLVGRWVVTDRASKPLMLMNLPVAPMSVEDKADDPDDRLIVQLTAAGQLRAADRRITLAGLAPYLSGKALEYDSRRRRLGKRGYETTPDGRRWSELFVLLRADQDVPFRQVQWVLAEIRHAGLYKVQLATRKRPGPEYTVAQAERNWAGREIYGPVSLEAKLSCYLSTAVKETGGGRFLVEEPGARHVDVNVLGSPPRYRIGERETGDSARLSSWIRDAKREARGDRKIIGRISAEARTPFGAIVAAVDSFASRGVEKVDLAGIERARESVRRASRLPRPDGP